MKKLATILLALILTLSLGATFIGCSHTHEWGEFQVTKAATCTAKGEKVAKCKGCEETKTEEIDIDPNAHDFMQEEDRIYTYYGSGEFLSYNTICHNGCGTIQDLPQSWGTFMQLQKVMTEDRQGDAVRRVICNKVIFDFDDAALRMGKNIKEAGDNTFKTMFEDKVLEIGKAGGTARTVIISSESTVPGLPTGKGDIKGKITVVNGKLIIKGNVDISGTIVVKSGCTLEIQDGAKINNTGSITIAKGGVLDNKGTVSGKAIVNNN